MINTRIGTRTIATGDHLIVDGDAGTVEVLRTSSVIASEVHHG